MNWLACVCQRRFISVFFGFNAILLIKKKKNVPSFVNQHSTNQIRVSHLIIKFTKVLEFSDWEGWDRSTSARKWKDFFFPDDMWVVRQSMWINSKLIWPLTFFVTNVSFEWIIANFSPVNSTFSLMCLAVLPCAPCWSQQHRLNVILRQVTTVCHDDVMMKAMVMVFFLFFLFVFILLPVLVNESGYFLVLKFKTKPINVHNYPSGPVESFLPSADGTNC